jgi:hypothetical protein
MRRWWLRKGYDFLSGQRNLKAEGEQMAKDQKGFFRPFAVFFMQPLLI